MSASFWVTIEKLSQQAVWLLLFAILAPILGPRPYGLFAIVMVFIGYCEYVTVEAAAEALMGMEPLEPKHLQTATTCNLLVSLLAGVAVFFAAPLFGRLFGDPELAKLFQALSILPAMSALTSAPVAVLKRQMNFRPLVLRSSVGLAIGGIAAVTLALTGAGVWALVAQILVQRGCEVVILWAMAGTAAGSGLGWSRPHYDDLRDYAAHVFVSRSMIYLGGQIPRLIIGYFLGPVDLGLFTLASRFPDTLAQVVISPRAIVARIELRQYRQGEESLRTAYYRLMRDTAFVGFPMSLGAAATVPILFSVWLDARWQAGVFASQLMFLTVPPMVVFYAASAVLMAFNFPREEAKISAMQVVTNGLLVLALVPFGLNAVCLGIVVRTFLALPYPALIVSRACGIPARKISVATAPLFGIALAMGLAVVGISPFLVHAVGNHLALAGLIPAGALIYMALVGLFAPDEARRFMSRLPFASRRLLPLD